MAEKDQKDLPVFAGGLHNTAQIAIWQEILRTETQFARDWEDKWSWMKAPKTETRSKARSRHGSARSRPAPTTGQSDGLSKSASSPSLAAAGQEMLQGQSRSACSSRQGFSDDLVDARQKVLERKHLVPKERYAKPMTSSMQHGWKPSIELFGVSHHGIRRDATITPTA
mmetsp:Transcript_51652/g.102669  ORF Transcript_51652/g.102669 Transcript_51652/m.102669 type:complete len:169 (+) Transcript_51652:68-574(+)